MTSIPDTGPTINSPSPRSTPTGSPHRRARGERNKQREEDIAVQPVDLGLASKEASDRVAVSGSWAFDSSPHHLGCH